MNEIADCIEHNTDAVREDIVRMVSGISVEADLQGYSAADLRLEGRDEILSAMVVYGFLSYHDGYLRIPNHELMEKYQRVLSRVSMGGVQKSVLRLKEMLEATQNGDAEKVAAILEETHDREIPFLQYHDENALAKIKEKGYEQKAWEYPYAVWQAAVPPYDATNAAASLFYSCGRQAAPNGCHRQEVL